jgi:acyl-CoA oxidase
VARRLQRGFSEGGDAFEIFNDCQDHMLLAARAHIERAILQSFIEAVDRVEDEAARSALQPLACLHALATIEADRGWFLEHGRLSGARSKAVTAAVNRLLGEVRGNARTLVDAFGIPDPVLGAPIAFTTVPEQRAGTDSLDRKEIA